MCQVNMSLVAVQRSAAPTFFVKRKGKGVMSLHRLPLGFSIPEILVFADWKKSESILDRIKSQILVCFPRCVHRD